MHHLANILFGIAGLLYFFGGMLLPSWRSGTRALRFVHAGSMGALFALNVLAGVEAFAGASGTALFALLAQALGLLGCMRVLVGDTPAPAKRPAGDDRTGVP